MVVSAKSEVLQRKKRKIAPSPSISSNSDSDNTGVDNVRSSSSSSSNDPCHSVTNKAVAGQCDVHDSSSISLFRLDGLVPQRNPKLARIHSQLEDRSKGGTGRRRSEDKSILMDLIDLFYPPLVCPVCFQIASGKSEADHHHKVAHDAAKAFACMHPSCDHTYRSKAGLRYHLDHAHTVSLLTDKRVQLVSQKKSPARKEHATKSRKPELPKDLQQRLDAKYDPTVCPACGASFPRKTNVIHHLVQNHRGEEPYKCVVAGCKRNRAYATREGLVYHLASYHDTSAA